MIAKRALDVLGAVAGLILLSPVLLLITIAIYIKMGGPILYRQLRLGIRGEPFVLFKFRTMLDLSNDKGEPLPDQERLLPFGRFLRSTSLDELPELWNVLRGEMSFVGPRPLLVRYLSRYNSEQRKRHDVKPGITGWAQIHGRNALSWEDKFKHDLWYINHWSFWLDLKILYLTILHILRREGISPEGQVTMPEFLGSGSDINPN